ncbi:S4 domain-containing protein [Litorimonas sp. RW-G-Af-16]|uniref:S4 domain-containing protein n=1 Tax=Litorimonas sp. RW-G-Af-16 TaxID=3241168 RepID=UPI00390C409B
MDDAAQPTADDACRLDVWLYRTRFFKTRTGATAAILGGKIRLTRFGKTRRIKKPHALLRIGESVTFMRGTELVQVEMLAPGTRRGPASEAQTLYQRIDGNGE